MHTHHNEDLSDFINMKALLAISRTPQDIQDQIRRMQSNPLCIIIMAIYMVSDFKTLCQFGGNGNVVF